VRRGSTNTADTPCSFRSILVSLCPRLDLWCPKAARGGAAGATDSRLRSGDCRVYGANLKLRVGDDFFIRTSSSVVAGSAAIPISSRSGPDHRGALAEYSATIAATNDWPTRRFPASRKMSWRHKTARSLRCRGAPRTVGKRVATTRRMRDWSSTRSGSSFPWQRSMRDPDQRLFVSMCDRGDDLLRVKEPVPSITAAGCPPPACHVRTYGAPLGASRLRSP
jgi:hypothetical protein